MSLVPTIGESECVVENQITSLRKKNGCCWMAVAVNVYQLRWFDAAMVLGLNQWMVGVDMCVVL